MVTASLPNKLFGEKIAASWLHLFILFIFGCASSAIKSELYSLLSFIPPFFARGMAAFLRNPKVLGAAALGAGTLLVASNFMRGEAGSAAGKVYLQL